MRIRFSDYLMAVVAVLMVFQMGAADALAGARPKVLIKLATLAPRGSEIMNIMEELDVAIREKTNNEAGFKIYYGGVQGDEKDVLRKMRMGQLHGGGFTGSGLGRIVPEVRVMELPYLFWNHEEVAYVRSQLQPDMEKRFEEKGYVVIGWNEVGFIYNFSKVPISSLEVARNQKWWMWEGDPLGRAVFNAFGITPVPLSFTEVMTSLSTKMIDAASITPYGAVAFQWHTRFDYMDEYPVTNTVGATIIKKDMWDRISPESQAIIREITPPYLERMNRLNRRQNEKSVEILKKSGIEIVPFNPDENTRDARFEAARVARENLVGELYSQELLDRTLSLVGEFRAAHPDMGVVKIH